MAADKYHRSIFPRQFELLFMYSISRQGFSRTLTLVSNIMIKPFSGSLRSRPHACENE